MRQINQPTAKPLQLLSYGHLQIASWYGASVSDTLAVCAAIGTDVLSGGRTRIFGPGYPLRVGRLDRATPAPPNTLPPEHQKTWGFANFWGALKRQDNSCV